MGVSSIIRGNGIVPEAFRLNEVIEGWQIALLRMHPGSRWLYISLTPWDTVHVPVDPFRRIPH